MMQSNSLEIAPFLPSANRPLVQRTRVHSCTDCNFIAPSSRLLSRHKAITHANNSMPCPLCPFVTIYQTNLLRHRREVHGILGTKGNKTCKFCQFKASDNETLIDHHTQMHPDILAVAVERFGKERDHATATNSTPSGTSMSTSTNSSSGSSYMNNFGQSSASSLTPEDDFMSTCYHHHQHQRNSPFKGPCSSECQYQLVSPLNLGRVTPSKSSTTSATVTTGSTRGPTTSSSTSPTTFSAMVTTTTTAAATTTTPETSLVSNSTDGLVDWSGDEDAYSEVDSTLDTSLGDVDFNAIDLSNIRPSLVEKIELHIEQLCLIERLETSTFLTNVKSNPNHSLKYKCTVCPAEFNKNCSYQFHMSLHGYRGEIGCELCNYGVDFDENLYIHQQLHFANLE